MTLGLKDLYYAVCTEADGAESYGTPKKMAEAMSADLSVKTADGSLYADDTLSESVTEFASGTLKLGIKDLTPEVLAELLGQAVDKNSVVWAGKEDEPPYVAVGFRAKKTGGKYRYVWLLKAKFKVPSEKYETKGESIKFNTPDIEASFTTRKKDKRKAGFMNMTITEFIEAAAHNKIIQLVVLAIVCDTVFGVLRAIKEKKFNSCAGIDGAIRKVGMLISLVFMLAIDVLIKINLIGFIPEQARTYLGLDTVGVAEFFALLYIAYEVVSIFKNMALCGLPVKKVWEKVREFLAKYTDELPDTDELDGDSTTGNVEEHRTQER